MKTLQHKENYFFYLCYNNKCFSDFKKSFKFQLHGFVLKQGFN